MSLTNLNFGKAFDQLLQTDDVLAIRRASWHGGRAISISGPLTGLEIKDKDKLWSSYNKRYLEQNGGSVLVVPNLSEMDNGRISMGWVPTSEDLFATDWQVL